MSTIDFTERELGYLLLALSKYEAQLLHLGGKDMEDRTTDLVFVQSLQQKIESSRPGK